MRLQIVNTLPESDPRAQKAIRTLQGKASECRIVSAYDKKISPCIGCNACWLRTPGICSVKDDYEEILQGYLTYDATVFLAGTALQFVNHRMKNLIDRMLPLATMYIHIPDDQCRHVMRYDRRLQLGLLYAGEADRNYLNQWMDRVMLNFDGVNLGAYPITQAEEVLSCIL